MVKMKITKFQNVGKSAFTLVALLCGMTTLPLQLSAENVGFTTNSTNPGNAFGAIAYSPSTQMYGSSVQKSRQAAEASALRDCMAKTNSHDCRTLVWFENSWGALAIANNGAVGTGWGSNEGKAKHSAIKMCSQYSGTNCRIIFTRRAVFYSL